MTIVEKIHPATGRRMRFVEAPADRVLTGAAFFWLEPVTGEQLDATNADIEAHGY